MQRHVSPICLAAACAALTACAPGAPAPAASPSTSAASGTSTGSTSASSNASTAGAAEAHPTLYRTVKVDGLNVFYREAGPPDGPVLLMLHGFPSSSRMYEPLFQRLSDRYRMIAPDYIGFGHSDAPPPEQFAYTFDHLTDVVEHFAEAMHLDKYVLVMQDYGGPVGFRLALRHPERVRAIIAQNANAYEDGLGPLWGPRRAFWADRAAHEAAVRANLISPAATRQRHLGTSPHPERIDPDTWTDETAFLNGPGQDRIQIELFYDYRTNVAAYPAWQSYMRTHQPPALIIWGRYDPSFLVAGATAYQRDLPKAEIHVIDAGHFVLDEAPDTMAQEMRAFLAHLS